MLNTNIDRLQLLYHEGVFPTREDAQEYINDYFKPESLISEPACVFYGDNRNPNVLLAIGTGNRKVFTIDTAELTELTSKFDDKVNFNEESINTFKNNISNLIDVIGLEFDENKKVDQISYVPDKKDFLLTDAKTITEALSILSKYSQDLSNELSFDVESSNTVNLIKKENSIVEAHVKLSESGKEDEVDFNDNIIGSKNDGLFASVWLDYDEEKKELIFTTSGIKNGQFKDDAYKKVFKLGEHTDIKASNKSDNPVVLTIKNTDEYMKEISGKLKISEDTNNILEIQDGNLMVDGRANNIKYKNKTVTSALNELYGKTDALTIKTELIPENSNTFIPKISNDKNGCTTIGGDVKLSTDKSIVVDGEGLSVNLGIEVDKVNNKIKIKVGDRELVADLPQIDLDGIIREVRFDKDNKTLIIVFRDGKSVSIEVGDLFVPYTFYYDGKTAVELTAVDNPDGITNVKATLHIYPTDNIIEKIEESGRTYVRVSGSKISNEINKEVLETKNELQQKIDLINEHISSIDNINIQQDTTINDLRNDVNANHNNITTLNNELTALKGEVSDEVIRAKAEEAELKQNLISVKDSILLEQTRAQGEERRLNGLILVNQSSINNINGSRDVVGSIRNLIDYNNTNVITPMIELKTLEIQNLETTVEDNYVSLKTDVEKGDKQTLETSKTYTDSEVTNVKRIIETTKTDILTQVNNDINTKTNEINEALAKKIENVRIEKNSASDLQYILYVDSIPVSEINIPKDKFLKDVRYDTGIESLVFTFVTKEDEDKIVTVDVSDFITTYKAGNGLHLEDNVFSVKLAVGSEDYLQITEDGIMLKGITSELDKKADKNSVYTKDESDALYIKEHQSLDDYAKLTDIDNVNNKVSYLEIAVATNKENINIINGNEAQPGSIQKSLADAKSYTDDKVSVEKQDRLTEETKINEEINKKANSSDVYTKTEIDLKNYLTEHQDISHLASTSSVTAIDTKITSVEDNVGNLSNDIENMKFTPSPSNSVNIALIKDENINHLVANVKQSQENGNIIKIKNDGLFAETSLTYDKSVNKLFFKAGDYTNEIELAGFSGIKNAEYDANNNSIIFTVVTSEGEERILKINVAEFVKPIVVVDNSESPIKIILGTDADGSQTIKANVNIISNEINGIENREGALYMSKHAEGLLGNNRNTRCVNLQRIISDLYTEIDNSINIANNAKKEVTNIKQEIETLTDKVNVNNALVQTIQTKVDTFETKINGFENRFNTIEDSIEDLKNMIKNLDSDYGTYN